jgi:hypothetical protein
MRRIAATLIALCVGGCVLPSGAAAQPIACNYSGGYPGDSAAKAQLSAWMASGAIGAGLPGELPVMGALVESGLANQSFGDADAVGFFQMRVSIWNQGQYAGFPDNPELQLKWFADQATAVNQNRAGSGQMPYGEDSNQWGEWAADVLRPPAQYRGRYQLRLAEARELINAGCAPGAPGPGGGQGADTTPPLVGVAGKRVQDPIRRRAIVVEASCPAEACVATARGRISLPGAAKVYKVKSRPRHIQKGGKAKLRLRLAGKLRRALAARLKRRGPLKVRISVTATDASGNAARAERALTLKHGS